jgi:hypothetical protein
VIVAAGELCHSDSANIGGYFRSVKLETELAKRDGIASIAAAYVANFLPRKVMGECQVRVSAKK